MPLLALLLVAASSPPRPPLPATIDLTRPSPPAPVAPRRDAGARHPRSDPRRRHRPRRGPPVPRHPGGTCQPDVARLLTPPSGADAYAEPHDLLAARIVHPRDHAPLLLLRVGSLHGANGDQRIATALFRLRPDRRPLHAVFTHQTGRNNNQEVRYIDAGPLAGRRHRRGADPHRPLRLLGHRQRARHRRAPLSTAAPLSQ